MKHLSPEAADVYLAATKWSFFLGLLSWCQLLDRLVALVALVEPSDPVGIHAQRILALEDLSAEDPWPSESGGTGEPSGSEHPTQDRAERKGPPGVASFIPGGQTGMSHWQFHKTDEDFFPSVPHGHGTKQSPLKLDAYLGWVYRRSAQVSREPRDRIVALWNDTRFRDFALASIDHFLEHHPYHRWRVPNPRRLPRHR